MASNPIKRRSRQSFFLGFLIALVIMAIVVVSLFTKINKLNQENEKLKILGPKITVYTVNKDIEEGEAIKVEDLQSATMQLAKDSSAIDTESYIDPTIFTTEDEETGEEKKVTYVSKVKITAGSVVTLSMLQEGGVANDERLMEYNMIVLPSQLVNGNYIDVRLRLPDGSEKIVLAKKKVEQCTATSIWMKMKEDEILTLNSAIVDAYLATGSQLRATVYTDPLMQEAVETNYPVNDAILKEITYNPNILNEAKNALLKKWSVQNDPNSGVTDFVASRRSIDSLVASNSEENNSKVEEGYTKEATDINTARSEYVTALEGTGMVGTTTGE